MSFSVPPRRAAAFALIGVLALTACSSSNEEAKAAIFDSLRPFESDGIATIELGKVVPGDWTQAVIVCRGAEQGAVDDALGFTWSGGPDISSPAFAAMFVFSDGASVESYVNLDQDKFAANDFYVDPCPLSSPVPPDYVPVYARGTDSMTFLFDVGTYAAPVWHPSLSGNAP
jgi:hypothetical protein